MPDSEPRNFFFLFRTDKGRIGRATWWRGTVPLALLALVGTLGWVLLQPYTDRDLAGQQSVGPMTILADLYLVVYSFAVILIAICEYNLSAKRFRDRDHPSALAAVLPLSLLVGSAVMWLIPRSFGSLPDWAAPVVIIILLLVALWNVVELGILKDRVAS
jgi:uncharacterized membrane protein YhaH (DUF805 family)